MKTAILVALLAVAVSAPAQVGRRGGAGRAGGRTQQQSTPKDKADAQEPLPSLPGTVKSIDRKMLITEDSDENALQFRCTKKTNYLDGSRQIAVSDIKPGDHVSVEARREPDGSLEAVNVRRDRAKP